MVADPMIVVPWFSKQEWLEVYDALFSDDIKQWKEAKDTILVWQARVEKLPAGVDVTLPLLQAKIMDADTTVDNSVKSIFLASAVQRFVSSILKLPQARYYQTKSMHHLALEIGLPVHLVDLRNEIVHGHGGWAAGETVHKAVDTSYHWIKGFYWDEEWRKLHKVQKVSPKQKFQMSKSFRSALKSYAIYVMHEAAKKKRSDSQIKACNKFVKLLEASFPDGSQECIEAIVSNLLLYDTNPHTANKIKTKKKQKCGCIFDHGIITGVNPVFEFLSTVDDSVETVLSCLITKTKESSKLALEWIYLIVGSILGMTRINNHNSICQDYILDLDNTQQVAWRKVVLELMETEEEWAAVLAGRIMECNETGFTDKQRESLMQLFTIRKSSADDNTKTPSTTPSQAIYIVDDVKEAVKEQTGMLSYRLEKLMNSVLFPGQETDCGVPLGVLPHQKGNPGLYKELLLHYPDSRECPSLPKKRKISKSSI